MQVFATTSNLEHTTCFVHIARRNVLPTQLEIILFFSSSKFTRGIHMQQKSGKIKALLVVFFFLSQEWLKIQGYNCSQYIHVHVYQWKTCYTCMVPLKKQQKNLTHHPTDPNFQYLPCFYCHFLSSTIKIRSLSCIT